MRWTHGSDLQDRDRQQVRSALPECCQHAVDLLGRPGNRHAMRRAFLPRHMVAEHILYPGQRSERGHSGRHDPAHGSGWLSLCPAAHGRDVLMASTLWMYDDPRSGYHDTRCTCEGHCLKCNEDLATIRELHARIIADGRTYAPGM